VTWCCGPSFGCRSGSCNGEPIIKPPAGIETISSPAFKPSASVNIAAEYFPGWISIPVSSTLGASKLIVRTDGLDINLLIEDAAMAAPIPTTASAATPNVCRRVSGKPRRNNLRCGSVFEIADALETLCDSVGAGVNRWEPTGLI